VSFGDPKYEDQHRLVVISCPDGKKAAWMIMQEAGTLSVYCECPQVVDRGTTARYGGQLRYI